MLFKAFFIFSLSLVILNPFKVFANNEISYNNLYASKECEETKGMLTNYFNLIKYPDIKKGDIILLENSEDSEVFIYENNGIASKLENGEFSYDIDIDYMLNEKELKNLIILRFDTEKFTNDIQTVFNLK